VVRDVQDQDGVLLFHRLGARAERIVRLVHLRHTIRSSTEYLGTPEKGPKFFS
jgi:hypothetical protein